MHELFNGMCSVSPPMCARERWCGSVGGLVAIMFTPPGKVCVNSSGGIIMVSIGRRVSHPRVAPANMRRG